MRLFYKLLLLAFSLLHFASCITESDSGPNEPFEEFQNSSLNGIWVDENLYTCMFPSKQKLDCDRLALNEWSPSLTRRQIDPYNYIIQNKVVVKTHENGREFKAYTLDNNGFSKPRQISNRDSSGQYWIQRKNQFELPAQSNTLLFHHLETEKLPEKDLINIEYKVVKTRHFKKVTEDEFKVIEAFYRDMSVNGPFSPHNKHREKEIIKKQADLLQEIIPQDSDSPHTIASEYSGGGFPLRFSEELVDAWSRREDNSRHLHLYQGKISFDLIYLYGVPICVMFPEGGPLSSDQEYIAEMDSIFERDSVATFYVYANVPSNHPSWRKLALRLYCKKSYSNDLILFSDLEYSLRGLISISQEHIH